MTLKEYIELNFDGSQRKFAQAQGVQAPQVTQWINRGFIVLDDELYSHRRVLKRKLEVSL